MCVIYLVQHEVAGENEVHLWPDTYVPLSLATSPEGSLKLLFKWVRPVVGAGAAWAPGTSAGPFSLSPVFVCSRVNEYGRLWFPVQNCFNWQRWSGKDVPSSKIHSGKGIWNPGLGWFVCPVLTVTICWMGDWAQYWRLGCRVLRHPLKAPSSL